MNGDLVLRRKRWWGAWAILATSLLCLLLFVPDVSLNDGSGASVTQRVLPVVVCLLLVLGCYAPWTFFWAFRLLGAAVVIGYAAYVITEAREGHWWSSERSSQSVFNAARGFLFLGMPALAFTLLRRPAVCPYDARGRLIPIETVLTLHLRRPQGIDRSVWEPPLRELVSKIELKRRLRRRVDVDWSGEPLVRVRLPIGPERDTLLATVRAELDRRGLAHDVGAEVAGEATMRTVLESVLARAVFL